MAKGSIEWEYDAEKGLVLRFSPAPAGLAGAEVRQHMHAVRREMLLVLKCLIDAAVSKEEKESGTPDGGTRIKVD